MRDPDVERLFKPLPSLEYHRRPRVSRLPTLARVNSYMKKKKRNSIDRLQSLEAGGEGGVAAPGKTVFAVRRKSSVLESLGGGGGEIRKNASLMGSRDLYGSNYARASVDKFE